MSIPLAPPGLSSRPNPPRYAVVFKTFAWNPFIERQARRWEAITGGGDFFIAADETGGQLGPMPFERVIRTNNDELIALGFANRFERGSLLWWSPDYVHYHFQDAYPHYDYYVFVEYDALFSGDVGHLVNELATRSIDFAAFPLKESMHDWAWTKPHLRTYASGELEGNLICITAFSRRALHHLRARRLQMGEGDVTPFWPSAEAFLPTEIKRAGLAYASMEEFGDITHLNWRPPHLEEDVRQLSGSVFFHPVYDQSRYLRWTIEQGATLRTSLDPSGPVLRALARFPVRAYLPGLLKQIWQNLLGTLRYRTGRAYWGSQQP